MTDLKNTPQPSQRLPLNLRIVAFLFLLTGIFSWIDLFSKNTEHHLQLEFGILGIPIYIGLLQLRPGWRTCALVLNIIALIFAIIALAFGLFVSGANFHFDLFGLKSTSIPRSLSFLWTLLYTALTIWTLRVLLRSKPLFDLETSHSYRLNNFVSANRAFAITMVLAILSYIGIFAINS